MSPETLTGVGISAFAGLLIKAWEATCRATSKKISDAKLEKKIKNLYEKISDVRNVMTIWQVEQFVDLNDFYCDPHVRIVNGKKEERKKIKQISDFNIKGNILIEGIAGQGKSIFLRYLCCVALAQGESVPLFVELRKISTKESIEKRIDEELKNLGLEKDIFIELAKSGTITLFLDAFDEIPEELKEESIIKIEDMSKRYNDMRIIVTSRPDNPIAMSTLFKKITLSNLQNEEYKNVIHMLCDESSLVDNLADNIIEHIQKKSSHVIPLLCTPLMVTLLVITYKTYNQLPNTLSGFYDLLFVTLLNRHDGTKPGFTRERNCCLDDEQYRKVFENLCLRSKKGSKSKSSFTRKELYDWIKEALTDCGFEESPQKYLNDIIKVTCLIVHDGEDHRFIHTTVQEYYAASFIKQKPELWVERFYNYMKGSKLLEWQQELFFLKEIDSFRYNQYYRLPLLLDTLGIHEKDLDNDLNVLSQDKFKEYIKLISIGLHIDEKNTGIHSLRTNFDADIGHNFLHSMVQMDYNVVKLDKVKKENDGLLPVADIVEAGFLRDEFYDLLRNQEEEWFNEAREIYLSLKSEEDSSILEELL